MNDNKQKFLDYLAKKEKVLIMLAPSFPIDFTYPNIIGMLKKIGVDKVTELTFGARMVNYWYVEYIKNHPDQKYFIASPCPNIKATIETKFPNLKKYLMPYASPMLAAAKIAKKYFPKHKIVFLSPCPAKQNLEVPQNKEFVDMAITFQELKEIFDDKKIKENDFPSENCYFDSYVREYTKIYPISGGLAATSHLKHFFNEEEICVADTVDNVTRELENISAGKSKYRFFDILNCPGGCIGGPSIANKQSIEERKKIIEEYLEQSSKETMGKQEGEVEFVTDIDFEIK